MWSSLSTYLYNDNTKDAAASSSPAAAAAQRPPLKINTALSPRTPSPRSSPITVALSGGSKKGATGDLKRSSFDRSDDVSILRGVIVGMKRTGKTSLIRRLRGEDPFRKQQPKSSSEQRKLMALVPWNVPADTDKIDNLVIEQEERVQLYVSESAGFVQSQVEQTTRKEWSTALQSQRGKEWNFVVWMIDPDMKNVLQHLQSGLDVLFPAADASEKTKGPVQHLCILLNFRDMQKGDNKSSTFSKMKEIIETTRRRFEEMENTKANDRESTKCPIIVLYESSMFDTYGLQQLHSFITLPYLAQKKEKLLRRAKLAQKQQLYLSKALMKSKVIDYNDFVASGNQDVIEEKPDKQTIERRNLEEEKERLKKQLKQQQRVLDSKMHRKNSPVIVGNQIISNEEPKGSQPDSAAGHNRKLFQTPSNPAPRQSAIPLKEVGETSLESFFSEDESDEEVETPRVIDKRDKMNTISKAAESRAQVLDSDDSSSDSSYDSDDDDFYIDISGARSYSNVTKKAFSAVESEEKSDKEEICVTAKEESASNENDVDQSKSGSDSVHSASSALVDEDEQEDVVEATESHSDENVDAKSNAGDDMEDSDAEASTPASDAEDESETVTTPSEPIHPYSGTEHSHADTDDREEENEEEKVDASSAGNKEEEVDETSNVSDDEIKANDKDLGAESELPVEDTKAKEDVSILEVDDTVDSNCNSFKTDCSNAESQTENEDTNEVEDEKTAPNPPDKQVQEDDDDNDDDDGSKEDDQISVPPNQHTLDGEDDEVPDEENEATASSLPEQQPKVDDGGDESEDEFIIPVSEEQQVYNSDEECSKLDRDTAVATREDNIQQEVSQTEAVKDVAETNVKGESISNSHNNTTVSSAALAAIEQARLEAEQMMAQTQPTKPKKEKKKKKDKVKKEKKAKKSKKKEELS